MGETGDNSKTASEQLNVIIRIDSEQCEQTLTSQFPRTQRQKSSRGHWKQLAIRCYNWYLIVPCALILMGPPEDSGIWSETRSDTSIDVFHYQRELAFCFQLLLFPEMFLVLPFSSPLVLPNPKWLRLWSSATYKLDASIPMLYTFENKRLKRIPASKD